MRLFVRCCGAEARNQALRALARGGVWICGGIAPRIRRWFTGEVDLSPFGLDPPGFRSVFEGTGSMRAILERVPCRLVTHPLPGLLGAARIAHRLNG